MIRASHLSTLVVLGSALLASGCSDSDKPSSASTSTAKPAPATTTPVTPAPSSTASKPATPPAPTTTAKPMPTTPPATTAPATAPAGTAPDADVAKVVDSLPPVPTQDDVDAAVQKSISDANADAEFDKLSKEIDSDKP